MAGQRSPLPDDVTVAAIIPARDERDTLATAVGSIQSQRRRVDQIVIAVADGPTRRVARMLAETDPRIIVVDNPDGGTSAGLNAAVAACDAEVLVRVDGHAVLPEDYVAVALAVLNATGAANVGGRQVPTAEHGFTAAVACAMRSPIGSGNAAYRNSDTAGPVDTVYLGVFRRDALRECGGFDARFVRNQDAELNERLRAQDDVVWFEPRLAVTYRPRGTLRALAAQYFGYGRWRRATAQRHPGSLRVRQIAAPMLVAMVLASLVAAGVLTALWPLSVIGVYVVAMVVAGFIAAKRPIVGLQVGAAFATMHLAWGVGFLVGPPRRLRRERRTDQSASI